MDGESLASASFRRALEVAFSETRSDVGKNESPSDTEADKAV